MTQENKPATTSGTELAPLSPEDQALVDQLKEGSNEQQNSGYLNIPYITIDNKMVDAKVDGGRDVKVRCEPSFLINSKVDDEYIKELFAPEFDAVILGFRHRVQRKYLQDQQGKCTNNLKYFRSLEFKSFQSSIHIRYDGKYLPAMKYGDVKKWAGDGAENELWGVVYFITKGEAFVRKAEFKGASRGVLFDYMVKKRDDSISSFITKFSLNIESDQANPYNKLVLTTLPQRPNLQVALKQQRELNVLLNNGEVPNASASEGEVVDNIPNGTPESNYQAGEELKDQVQENVDKKAEDGNLF